ncbi:MAG: polysaccharide deacetylase [Alistipes sp.]|nr:polysaccharide deacetylase [Alistipes sp.]
MTTGMNIEEENRRRRRINRIKKIIICLVIVCITVPTALSGMLMVKVVMLERELEDLRAKTAKTLTATNNQTADPHGTDIIVGDGKTAEDADLFEIDDVDKAAQDADIISNEQEGRREVYLTFDDGPSDNTDEILDILKQYNVKATFFVVAKNDEESIRRYNRIVDEGHTLAMHSYTHVYNQIYADMNSYKQDVLSLQDFLYEATGIRPVIYRFPGGSSNTIMNIDVHECISFLNEQNITYFDWNVSSGDATGNGYPASTLAENVINGCAKQDIAVVLMHDANNKDATVASLPTIIETFQAMDDVALLPLTEDSYPVRHTK